MNCMGFHRPEKQTIKQTNKQKTEASVLMSQLRQNDTKGDMIWSIQENILNNER